MIGDYLARRGGNLAGVYGALCPVCIGCVLWVRTVDRQLKYVSGC